MEDSILKDSKKGVLLQDQYLHAPIPQYAPRRRKASPLFRYFKVLLFVSCIALASIFRFVPASLRITQSVQTLSTRISEPADEWRDDIFPIRPQTPWDISTSFPFPRSLEYDVNEGTWLRLDVHPKTGDLVWDMVGDLWCLPAGDSGIGVDFHQANDNLPRARPVLLGIPHDSDPHFSPEGDRLVFRSDAELGVENIWVMEWKGCEKMDVRRSRVDDVEDVELLKSLEVKQYEDDLLASGFQESIERKRRRLLREGRAGAQRVTNETFRWVSDARFHPSESKVIATKWYTSSRSLGAGEGWEYPVPSLQQLRELGSTSASGYAVQLGSGTRLVGRTLPPGWDAATQYGDQQIGPEQVIWAGAGDELIFSKNVIDQDTFQYSKDVHKGIYAIFSKNLLTNRTEELVGSFPGGASRPELSRDGKTLAFVRRVRDKEALVLKDLQTGSIHHVWHGLSYDLSTISAPMGTYPSFAFTPSDDAVIIWAAGQIYSVPLSTNSQGEKIASPTSTPTPIRFTAHIEKRLAETREIHDIDFIGLETADTQRVHAFKELRVDDTGSRVVFQAASVIYVQNVGSKDLVEVPVLHPDAPYYSPAFVHGADDFVLHARWSDTNFTTFEMADLKNEVAYELTGLPLGRYYSPILCECSGSNRQIAFIKTGGDYMTGNIIATAKPGLYIGELTLPTSNAARNVKSSIPIVNIRSIPSQINPDSGAFNMRFLDGNTKLLVQQDDEVFVLDLAAGLGPLGEYKHEKLASGKMSTQIAVSPRPSTSKHAAPGYVADGIAFVDFFQVYFAPGSKVKEGEALWSKPGNATEGLVRISLDGGHDVVWSRDGKKVFWLLGPFLHSLEISKLSSCSSDISHDTSTFGISCVKGLLEYQEIVIEHSTDIARLKQDAAKASLDSANADVLAIFNATILTMATGDSVADLIHDAVMIVKGGVIEKLCSAEDDCVPVGTTIIDAQGGFVTPGFIDVHAHWEGFGSRYPTKSWEMETFLAYGITTMHNPSADNVEGFVERSRVESGQYIGPRIFTVGDVIYGGLAPSLHQDIADSEEAHSALVRIKAEGGRASTSYKNYNLPSRASRQRLLLAARNMSMLCFPEGGMNYDWDLTYIVDGMTTVEHALPIPALYDDVITLYALSGTGSTPTHLVNYGGVMGEQLVWATEDVPNNPKLRKFSKHDRLLGLTESTSRPAHSYAFFNTSTSVAKMVQKGLRAHIGAHGEQPLGLNYHYEMLFTKYGGLSNYEVIQAATSSAAITLGLFDSLGSLSPGKLADFLVYLPGVDLLDDPILSTTDLVYVSRGGRIWDAGRMEEVWPVKRRKQVMPPLNAE